MLYKETPPYEEREKQRGRWRLFIFVFYVDWKMHDLVAVLKLADSVR